MQKSVEGATGVGGHKHSLRFLAREARRVRRPGLP